MPRRAFTLIELLIVVAIIGILAAIAVPNFLEAQTRGKVSRTRSDMRSMATAIELYCLDQNAYPLPVAVMAADAAVVYPMPSHMHSQYSHNFLPAAITTPLAYMTRVPFDVFADPIPPPQPENSYVYYQNFYYTEQLAGQAGVALAGAMVFRAQAFGSWVMFACGPDGDRKDMAPGLVGATGVINAIYDPTNGSVSNGDIIRTQRGPSGPVL